MRPILPVLAASLALALPAHSLTVAPPALPGLSGETAPLLVKKGNNGNGNGQRANPGRGNGNGPPADRGNGNRNRDNNGVGNGNVPPGHARQLERAATGGFIATAPVICADCAPDAGTAWQGLARGETAREEDLLWLAPEDTAALPELPEGQRYAVINGTVVALEDDSYEVLELIRTTFAAEDLETRLARAEETGAPVVLTGASPFFCPPGLADREPACVPPGQARQGVTTEEWLGYGPGDAVPEDAVVWIDNETAFGDLPPLPEGQRYAVINGTIVALDEERYELLELVRTAAALLE